MPLGRMDFYITKSSDTIGNEFFRIFGVRFADFIKALGCPKNLLLLTSSIPDVQTIHEINFDAVLEPWLDGLIESEQYLRGDFCWIDFESERDLISIPRQELAHLSYLRLQSEPFDTPFFDSLRNRYIYFSHDDGWLTSVYFRDTTDVLKLISSLVSLCENQLEEVVGRWTRFGSLSISTSPEGIRLATPPSFYNPSEYDSYKSSRQYQKDSILLEKEMGSGME